MLDEAQRRALLLHMHRSIEEVAAKVASELQSGTPSLLYPPNSGFTDKESGSLAQLSSIPCLESALRKVVASAAASVLYYLIVILDGIGDPADYEGEWLGATIEPVLYDPDATDPEPWRYDFFDSYWEWRKTRPDTGWCLDNLSNEGLNEPL